MTLGTQFYGMFEIFFNIKNLTLNSSYNPELDNNAFMEFMYSNGSFYRFDSLKTLEKQYTLRYGQENFKKYKLLIGLNYFNKVGYDIIYDYDNIYDEI